ncbi:15923_t:CDS:2, partial [Acaulospora morrowiae]
ILSTGYSEPYLIELEMSQSSVSTLLEKVNQNGKTTLQRLEVFIKTVRFPLKAKIAERVETPLDIESITYNDFNLVKHIMDGKKYQVQKALWNNEGDKIFVILKLEEKSDETEHREIIGELHVYHSVNAKNTHEDIIKFYGSSSFFLKINTSIQLYLFEYVYTIVPDGSPVIVLECIENQDQHNNLYEDLSEEIMITGIMLREQQKYCDDHPHDPSAVSDNSSMEKLFPY